MRSRDGNRSFLLSICTLILLFSRILTADEYLISYRYTVKDATLYNDSLQVSRAMKKCSGMPAESIFLYDIKSDNLKTIVQNHLDEFISFINKIGFTINHKEKTVNMQNSSTTHVIFKSHCFEVDFNDKFVKITQLIQKR